MLGWLAARLKCLLRDSDRDPDDVSLCLVAGRAGAGDAECAVCRRSDGGDDASAGAGAEWVVIIAEVACLVPFAAVAAALLYSNSDWGRCD